LKTEAEWGADVPPGRFGARAQALVAYCTGRLGLSHRDVVEAMNVPHGVELSWGTVAALQQQVSARLAVPVETARRYVRQQAVNYVDETGWQEKAEQCWLWLNATKEVTTFHLLAQRNSMAARTVIGPGRDGVITTDRFRGYDWLSAERRQVCWARLKRDFQAMVERGAESKEIGAALLQQTKQLFNLWHRRQNAGLGWRRFQRLIAPIREQVKAELVRGVDCKAVKTRGTCRELCRLEASLWTFARVRGVSPTNNRAKRGLRRAVLWRRKSFGTQSPAGSQLVERILTVVTTLRQQRRDVLQYLTAACTSALSESLSICLLPDSS
jgi:transposase